MMRKRWKEILLLVCLAVLQIFLFTGCGDQFSDYQDARIEVSGLGDTFYVTPEELSQMECSEAVAQGETEKAGTVTGYGPTLETFVKQYGYELADLASVRFTAGDDYAISLGRITWEKYPVIMSVMAGQGKGLYKNQQPLRLVIPGGKSGNWIYNIEKMEFKLKEN